MAKFPSVVSFTNVQYAMVAPRSTDSDNDGKLFFFDNA